MATLPAAYNPNTGKPLYVGQTVTFEGKTYSGTTAKPSTTTSTSTSKTGTTTTVAPKPAGINTISTTLNIGSSGDQVKELQKYLAGLGYTNADGTPLKVDGIYGSNTQTAVKQFQSQNGLKADGIFGPLSLAGAQKLSNTGTAAVTPKTETQFNTGDPAQDALLKELQTYIKSQQDQGLVFNAALNFDQKTLDKFLETAKAQVHPFYQSQIDTIKQDVLRAAPQILENYGRDIASQQAAFSNTLDRTRESLADRGMAYSGFRGEEEKELMDAQNRSLASLSQGYGNQLYDLGRGAEKQIGADNANYNLGSLSNYSATTKGPGTFTLGGTTSPYQSGGYKIGALQYDEAADAERRRQALLTSASNSVVAGRSYEDLYNK